MEILEKVKSRLPEKSVSRAELEGSEIIVYTKDRKFFQNYEEIVREVVEELKKRIEIRPEKEICADEEEAMEKIKQIVPEDAKIKNIYFEPERGLVIIAAEKPGLVIGRGGETFRKIRSEIFWVPRIERIPPLKSEIVDGIRKVLHDEVKFRKELLNKIGEKIFSERKTSRDWIRVIGLGACREVGRSAFLIETPKSKVVVDLGIKVGATNGDMFPVLQTREFDPNELDAVIISHAHLDHCGLVPYLYAFGYNGPVYMTTPTLDLFAMNCLDYVDVQQKNAMQTTYTAKDVKEAVKHTISLDLGEVSDVAPDIRLTFQNAGHILGSALVHLHVGEGMHNIVYASDMKYGKTTLLDPAFTDFQRVETLIMESTYGSFQDIMPPRIEAERHLVEVINKTMERKGQVLIPSFAIERAQEVMAILAQSDFEYPVYVDGMIMDATGIYTAYPEYMSRVVQRQILSGEDPFRSPIFKRIASQDEREKAWNDKPSVIISTSGMLMGGPAVEHLKALAEDQKNSLLFVGFQAENTMGRRIQRGWREIPLRLENGKTITINLNMEIQTIEGLSGHSDRNQLLSFVSRLSARPERVIVIHGESQKTLDLARTVHKLFRMESVAPKVLEGIRLR